MSKVAFFDLDNTLIRGSSLALLAGGLVSRGLLPKTDMVRYLLHNLRYIYSKSEKLNVIEKLAPAALGLLSGHKEEEINKICGEIVQERLKSRIYTSVTDFISQHQQHGIDTWLVTASPIELARPIAMSLGMTGALGTICEVRDGAYSGELLSPILHGRLKAAAAMRICEREGYNHYRSFAYSDSISDLPLLAAVGSPTVVNPNSQLLAIAKKNNWNIHFPTKVAA